MRQRRMVRKSAAIPVIRSVTAVVIAAPVASIAVISASERRDGFFYVVRVEYR